MANKLQWQIYIPREFRYTGFSCFLSSSVSLFANRTTRQVAKRPVVATVWTPARVRGQKVEKRSNVCGFISCFNAVMFFAFCHQKENRIRRRVSFSVEFAPSVILCDTVDKKTNVDKVLHCMIIIRSVVYS